MKSFITFFREAYLPPKKEVDTLRKDLPMYPATGVESLPIGVPIYIGDGKPVKRPKKSLDINKTSESNITSTPATQKSNSSVQDIKNTPDLNLNQEKLGTHAIRYYMK